MPSQIHITKRPRLLLETSVQLRHITRERKKHMATVTTYYQEEKFTTFASINVDGKTFEVADIYPLAQPMTLNAVYNILETSRDIRQGASLVEYTITDSAAASLAAVLENASNACHIQKMLSYAEYCQGRAVQYTHYLASLRFADGMGLAALRSATTWTNWISEELRFLLAACKTTDDLLALAGYMERAADHAENEYITYYKAY